MQEIKFYQKKWFKIAAVAFFILILSGGIFTWKTGSILNKIGGGGVLKNIGKLLPGINSQLDGEKEGKINILLLGMRGENVPGGGLLADTIIIASIAPETKKASILSIPRDFYVEVGELGYQGKINAVYYYGEEREKDGGLKYMKKITGEIVGAPIHYGAVINFKGFSELVDDLGGVEIHLDQPFSEPLQFHKEQVCDENTFTFPSGNYEVKKNEKDKVVARYPLCYNRAEECGGIFNLPAGDLNLNGEQALCYVRSRVTSSDFDRARRQQEIIKQIKKKALSAGTLTDFRKINNILDSLSDNIRTDMQVWEMKRLWEIYGEMGDQIDLHQKVLENSEEGLLYSPEITTPEQGYILLPRGENYSRIQEMFFKILE